MYLLTPPMTMTHCAIIFTTKIIYFSQFQSNVASSSSSVCVCEMFIDIRKMLRVSHLTPRKTPERQSECKTCLIFNPSLWLFSAGTLKMYTPWLYVECQLWLQTHSFLPFVHLVPAGHRTAEERGEKMGQKVEMDEHEGGVWTSVLYGLAEPVCSTRPRQGRRVPVHCVRAGRCAELCWTLTDRSWSGPQRAWTPLNHFYAFFHSWIFFCCYFRVFCSKLVKVCFLIFYFFF